jgi:hypothetical protein
MARGRPGLGWLIAAVIGIGWLASDNDAEQPRAILPPAPTVAPDRTQASTPTIATGRQTTPATPSTLPQAPEAEPVNPITMYAKARTRVRVGPSTETDIVTTVEPGTSFLAVARQGRWLRITVGRQAGWIRDDLLSTVAPRPPAAAPLITTRSAAPEPVDRGGEPTRDPVTGSCDCPYDRMRNGRRCGGNSAYSRPGGRSPVCYF